MLLFFYFFSSLLDQEENMYCIAVYDMLISVQYFLTDHMPKLKQVYFWQSQVISTVTGTIMMCGWEGTSHDSVHHLRVIFLLLFSRAVGKITTL